MAEHTNPQVALLAAVEGYNSPDPHRALFRAELYLQWLQEADAKSQTTNLKKD